jgi:hypothetical protein
VLNQVSAILDVGADGVLCVMVGRDRRRPDGGGGHRRLRYARGQREVLPKDHPLLPTITKAFREKHSQFEHPANVLFIHTCAPRS